MAEDFDGLVAGAEQAEPQVVVTDIRMPPNFQNEGIEAAKLVRKRHPGTGVVVLSQYDEPEYAISLLSEGAAGYAYLLKDRVGDGDQLCRAVREVATGGSMLDPAIVDAIVAPARADDHLDEREDQLLQWIAEGRPVKAIAVAVETTAEAANDAIEDLFLKLAKEASAGREGALRRLRLLQKAIVDREEQGETLSRLLPGGLAEKLRRDGHETGRDRTARRHGVDVGRARLLRHRRARRSDRARRHAQHAPRRDERRDPRRRRHGDAVRRRRGDGGVRCAVPAARPRRRGAAGRVRDARTSRQRSTTRWRADGLPEFGLGIGLSTGEVAAALLGSDERLEYTLVGDTVNLAQRLQDSGAAAGHGAVGRDASTR